MTRTPDHSAPELLAQTYRADRPRLRGMLPLTKEAWMLGRDLVWDALGLLRIPLRMPPPLRSDTPAAAVGERLPDLLLLSPPLARRSTTGLVVAEPLVVLSLLLTSPVLLLLL